MSSRMQVALVLLVAGVALSSAFPQKGDNVDKTVQEASGGVSSIPHLLLLTTKLLPIILPLILSHNCLKMIKILETFHTKRFFYRSLLCF